MQMRDVANRFLDPVQPGRWFNMSSDKLLKQGLACIDELARRNMLHVVIGSSVDPNMSHQYQVTRANFNGPFIDLWIDEKFAALKKDQCQRISHD